MTPDTVASRHKAKGPDNGTGCKFRLGSAKLTLSWVKKNEQSGPALTGDEDEMGSC